jgi:hypothetical protein
MDKHNTCVTLVGQVKSSQWACMNPGPSWGGKDFGGGQNTTAANPSFICTISAPAAYPAVSHPSYAPHCGFTAPARLLTLAPPVSRAALPAAAGEAVRYVPLDALAPGWSSGMIADRLECNAGYHSCVFLRPASGIIG